MMNILDPHRRASGASVVPKRVAALGACAAALALGMAVAQAPPAAPRSAAPSAPPSGPRGAFAPEAWTPLFDGSTLAGWKVFTPGAKEGQTTFSAAEGVLTCTGAPAGYIATEATFDDFELELQWRFDPAKGAGNSGVLLRVADQDEVWPRSIEAQLHSGNAGDIWNIGGVPMKPDASRTEGRRTKKAAESSEKPLGEWNKYRIRLVGGSLELWVNGVLQNKAEQCEVRKGRIALQSEGAFIQFRDIRIRPLAGGAR